MKTRYVIAIYVVISLCFCQKKEEPIPKKEITIKDSRITVVEMGSSYTKQLYFSLEKDTVIKENLETDWDLAFSCSEDKGIFLNTAHSVKIAQTEETNFSNVNSFTGLDFISDVPSLNPDSTAFGKWYTTQNQSKKLVYVVNLGKDYQANELGYKKLQITNYNNGNYTIKYANLNGSEEKTLTLNKNTTTNNIYVSFENGIADIEPNSTDWDLHFTQFDAIFEEEDFTYYTVTGALHNPKMLQVAETRTLNFNDITLEDVVGLSYSTAANTIGYDWKSYDIEAALYTIDTQKVYVLKKGEQYYKLRFLEFYNTKNAAKEAGYPMFEYQEL